MLIICYALDRGPMQTWPPAGERLPTLLASIMAKPPRDLQIAAHNAAFDRHVLARLFLAVSIRHWYCTATQARANALAGSPAPR